MTKRIAKVLAWLTALALPAAFSGCSNDACQGVVVDGQCEPLCVDDDCGSGERCVDNLCSPECDADSDCPGGVCRSVTADYGGRSRYCLYETRPAKDAGAGPDDGTPPSPTESPPEALASLSCEDNSDCTESNRQVNCIDGQCVVACLLHEHCAGTGACTGEGVDADGATVAFCEGDDFPRHTGQYGWGCLNGNSDCDDAAGFRCLSRGEGDIDGYCAQLGCNDDASCPTGYYCNRDVFGSLAPCESACGLPGAPQDPECIPAEDIGQGRPFACADGLLELRSCRKRDFCNSCESDADCRGTRNQVCARDAGGSKICTVICDPLGTSCPWGSATSCDVYDTELGVPTCSHRAGTCAEPNGASCAPCVDDADCPGGFCSGSSFTGERFCLDFGASCACPAGEEFCVGGGCPATPGGLEMNCVPAATGEPPSVCFGASVIPGDPTGQIGCWPQ